MAFPHLFDQEVARYRLAVARKLNNISQKEASKMLGYANSGALSKIENPHFKPKRKITIELLYCASICYGVNIAFLTGLTASSDFDVNTGYQAAMLRGLKFNIETSTQTLIKELQLVSMQAKPMLDQIIIAIDLIGKAYQSLDKFKKLNPDFDDMRGGNSLSVNLEKLKSWSVSENQAIKRAKKAKQIAVIMGMDMDNKNASLIDEKIEDVLGDEYIGNDKGAQEAFNFPV